MIDYSDPSETVDEGLRVIIRNLKEQEKKLMGYLLKLIPRAIQALEEEKLMEISLGLNDDLNKVII